MEKRQEISGLIRLLIGTLEAEVTSGRCSEADSRRIENAISYLNSRNELFIGGEAMPILALAIDHLGLLDFYMNRVHLRSIVQRIDEEASLSGLQLQPRRV